MSTGPNADNKLSAGSIAGAGTYYLGSNELTVGGNNLSTTVSGVISDCGGGFNCVNSGATGGSLVKVGSGALTLAGINTYTGATTVNGGTLAVDGSIASSTVTVNSGGTLSGTGTVGDPTISTGGTLAPGSVATPYGTLTLTGPLTFQTGSFYNVNISPSASSQVNVTGAGNTATLGGATVNTIFASGSYVSKQYTILTATGGVSGTFGSLVNTNLPANFNTSLSYDANDVYLNLLLKYAGPSYGGLSGNQQAIGNALTTYFNANGGIPAIYASLSPQGLSQASGEAATSAQTGAFQFMNEFLGAMLDPFAGGRGGSGGAALGFAPERQSELPPDIALAYAQVFKAPPPQPMNFERRWSVWGTGFGGGSSTSGNAALGSNDVTARTYGFATGADYHLTRDTVLGFALAGGGTNWGLAQGLGGGRGDAFQAGVYAKSNFGPAYVAASLAFANYWMNTSRTALSDQLTANFNAQGYGGRIEGGYRLAVTPTMGITPYAAMQAQVFDTPAYSETDLASGGFGLAFAGRSATDTRSELGARFDRLTLLGTLPLILRARIAWAHDWVGDPTLNAVFETLPGAAFTVNGASPANDLALTTLGAELRLSEHWTLAAKFDGEFAAQTQTYAGTGTLRASW
ncbi:MAG: autotransporter domain-containing protein [Bradyrhizobium sp.]